MDGRIVIISDLHLGRPHQSAKSAQALRPLWRGAQHLVINGDVAEVHHPKHWSIAARETMQLFDLCEADGVELTLLSGNHDPYVSDVRHLHMADDRVFVTHGDVLHPAVAPWSPASGRIREAHEEALAALGPELRNDLESRLSACQHASYAEWQNVKELEEEAIHSTFFGMLIRPWALMKVLRYWWIFPALAAEFTKVHSPEAKFIVLGHTHRPGVWEIADRVIINTGSFGFPGTPRAVVIEEDKLRVVRIRLHGEAYGYDATPLSEYELP